MSGRPTRRTAVLAALGAGAAAALPAPAAHARSGGPAAKTPPVVVTEQATRRILVLDPAKQTWDPAADPAAVLWAFSPEGDARYADLQPEASWTYVNEAKARRRFGRTFVLTTASFGFAAVVEHPTGKRYWGGALAPGTDTVNPHSIELLPDGNVAIASSTGDSVRIYTASQGPASPAYAELRFDDAHGVQWDGGRGVLWAIGHDELAALKVGGTRAEPTLTRAYGVPLPHPPGVTAGGHDMNQVAGDPDRLWVTTNQAVYQYVKSKREFRQDFPAAELISRPGVKAVTDAPTGQVASTAPEPGLGETWWTTTVGLHHPTGTCKLVNGGIYKARWWLP